MGPCAGPRFRGLRRFGPQSPVGLLDAPAVGVDRLDDEAVSQQQDAGTHLVQEIEDVAGDEERAAVREVVATSLSSIKPE